MLVLLTLSGFSFFFFAKSFDLYSSSLQEVPRRLFYITTSTGDFLIMFFILRALIKALFELKTQSPLNVANLSHKKVPQTVKFEVSDDSNRKQKVC